MDSVYECTKNSDSVTMADIQWFFAKSKVPICLAITDSLYFLNKLMSAALLTEAEVLELQGDTRPGHRVVYECLCWIEEQDISLEHFFTFLFQKSLLKKYPALKPVHSEYIEEKYRYGIHSTTDEAKDPLIFAQDKVQICLIITDRFPFLHGLQDLTILSESESLKLQADERPVSRVIYESLSLIEKKDMKLNIVFEYIFQQCYLNLYPGLQDILREPSGEFVAPFNGGQYPTFNIATDLLEFFEHNKTYICEAVNERFPFLHGLHDRGLLTRIQLLRLQADKKCTKEVLYEALSHIKTINDSENFFAYLFQEFYLKLFPDLHIILQCLNAALTLDIYSLSPVSRKGKTMETQDSSIPIAVIVKDEVMDLPDQNSTTPSTVLNEGARRNALERASNGPSTVIPKDEITETPEQDSRESFLGSDESSMQHNSFSDSADHDYEYMNGEQDFKGSDRTLRTSVRRCRMRPINYFEPPDLDWEAENAMKDKASENSRRHKHGRRKSQEANFHSFRTNTLDLKRSPDLMKVTKPVTVKLEFPKQVFNDKFKVRCGNKTGIFKKKRWTGHSSNDLCIRSEGKRFSVTGFERYGGRAASKSWKKTIQCEEIKLECLIKAGILKRPLWIKKPRSYDPKCKVKK